MFVMSVIQMTKRMNKYKIEIRELVEKIGQDVSFNFERDDKDEVVTFSCGYLLGQLLVKYKLFTSRWKSGKRVGEINYMTLMNTTEKRRVIKKKEFEEIITKLKTYS